MTKRTPPLWWKMYGIVQHFSARSCCQMSKRCTIFAVVGPFMCIFKQICFPVFCHFWSTIITDRHDATPVEIHGIKFVVNNILEVFRCNAADECMLNQTDFILLFTFIDNFLFNMSLLHLVCNKSHLTYCTLLCMVNNDNQAIPTKSYSCLVWNLLLKAV